MKTIITAALTSLIAVLPATADPKPTATPDAAVAAASTAAVAAVRSPATRYCYKTEMTGSHIVTTVCKTRSDWKDIGVIVPKGL
ncbi:hypothetical protein [Sphingomonas endophytica]|uniref:Uncharacterized protein n=1 Tax=Sphingomonas endophytica TaxID=869719 RepID=A0A147I8U3_9SPHN|nr:hypothetical protein [Sphingomonas endophytica]KTT75726.1 hypothetical protein NS334_02175 [Sphingomonas endophytica]